MSDELAVLSCPGCGSAVPLVAGASTRCEHCDRAVEIPPQHRDALALVEQEVAADALTAAAFHELGRAPAWPLRFLSGFVLGFGALLLYFGVVAAVEALLLRVEGWLAVAPYDWLSEPELTLITFGVPLMVVALAVVLGVFGSRRAIGLGALQSALAARPPARPGGTSRCRECGAPLGIPADAVGVRCPYCRTDNLVAIPATWIERARRSTSTVARQASGALAQQRSERRRLRIRLALALGIVVALGAIFLGGTVATVASGESSSELRNALVGERVLFDSYAPPMLSTEADPVAPTVPIDGCATTRRVAQESMSCIEGDCRPAWFVAMRAGETLLLRVDAGGRGELYQHIGTLEWERVGGFGADAWGELREQASIDGRGELRLRAYSTAWYRVQLVLEGVGDELEICAALERGGP